MCEYLGDVFNVYVYFHSMVSIILALLAMKTLLIWIFLCYSKTNVLLAQTAEVVGFKGGLLHFDSYRNRAFFLKAGNQNIPVYVILLY